MKNLKLFMGLVCMLCLITNVPSFAQQTVTGRIVNARTSSPIENANVLYNDNGTSTDAKGQFRIPCEPPVLITVSYVGYRTLDKTIQSCSKNYTIELTPQTYVLQDITVEGEVDIDRATSIGTLSRADLNNQTGLRLKDALNTIPGVEMQTRSPFGGQRISIRGYYPNAGLSTNFNGLGYQLYLNDIPVTDATGTTIMDDIDFSSLGRVQVIKGPSPLYGNEISGTVNLYTQRPQQNGTTISEQLVAGSFGLFRNNTTLMTRSDNLDLRINYGRQSYDSFRPQDASEKDYVTVSAHYQVTDDQQISGYFSYNNSDEELAGGLINEDFTSEQSIAVADYVNNDGGVELESFRAGITSSHLFSSRFSNKTTVFATGHTLDQNFARGFNFNNNLNFGARTNFRFQQQLQNIGVTGQLGAFIQKSDESQDGVFIPPSISAPFSPGTMPQFPTNIQTYAVNANVFTKWEFALPGNFIITAGGILNFNKFGIRDMLNEGRLSIGGETLSRRFDPAFSPSASVLKSFADDASVYASISTGNTPPLLGDIIASDGSVNNRLHPEDAVQYEIGSKGKLLNSRLSYQVSLFDLEINNRLATQFIDGIAFTTNVGEQQNRGVELSAGYNIIQNRWAAVSKLGLSGSYTYSDFSYEDFRIFEQDGSGNSTVAADFSGNDVAGVAPHRVNISLDVQTKPGIYLHTKYTFMDETAVTFNNQTFVKSYNLLDARLGFEKTIGNHFDLDAYIGSNNITGSTYYNFLFVGQNEAALGDGYIYPAPYNATLYGGATLSYTF